ncbi:hypothetical protein PR202_gb23659 [Eleusine coracana subsp. coracana]|uniref:MSP domain-containing protein n=1 Tax=Eleusine coracana subsp. coracana TaxID=191504 RepID=A0AAV5FJQ1_ELECO|nr:hypothetical protein PR202_gb23659 [Eleusine coracana subsp. coracana]
MVAPGKEGPRRRRSGTTVLKRWRHRWNKSAKDTLFVYQQVATCLDLAIRCTNADPVKRPDMSDIICELNKLDGNTSDVNESFAQIGDLEDMIGIEPLKTHLHFELNKQVPCSIQLSNDTEDYFAFSISTTSLRPYNIYPSIDIVPPGLRCSVTISLQPLKQAPLEEQCKEEFTVLSTRVDGSLKAMEITGDLFDEGPDRVVDKVDLTVVLDVPKLAGDW